MSNPGCILKRTSINKIGGNGNNYNDGTAHDRKNFSLELVITMSYPPQYIPSASRNLHAPPVNWSVN